MTRLSRVFVYGTLKRGGTNHPLLAKQTFEGEAVSAPGFRMYELDGYPGLVRDETDHDGVTGEVWTVDSACLARLDELEGTAEGLYLRTPIPLLAPFNAAPVEAFLYRRSTAGRKPIGRTWPV